MTLSIDKVTWKHVSLSDVVAASKEKVDPSTGVINRYVAGEHMDSDDLKIHRWGNTSDVDLGPAFHRRFRPGQVLYGSRRTYLRKVAVADFDGVCANTTYVLESKDEHVLLQEFLPFVMSSETFHAFAIRESRGSVNPYVNWSDLERFEFHLPPLDEQKRIVDLLWAAELHRRSLYGLERSLSASTQSVFTRLIARFHAEKQSLGDLGKFTRGRRFTKSDYVDKGLGCIHYAQIHTDFGPSTTEAITFLPNSMRPAMRMAKPGDLIVAGTSEDVDGVGKAVAWLGDEDVAIHDDCFIYSHEMDPLFASLLFASAEFDHAKRTFVSESKVVRLSATSLGTISLPVPSLSGQREVVRVLSKLARGQDKITDEIGVVRALQQALSAAIFEGE